ncbi:Fe-S cluster assembly protein SufD [Immundisolibacter sp.]
MSALAHWQAQYAQRSSGAEPAWLRELRSAAWSGFEAHGLPGRRDEDWKYTRLSALERFAPKAPLELAELPTIVPTDGALLVFAGGRLLPQWSRLPVARGVEVSSLAAALATDGDALRSRLRLEGPERPFASLNQALFEDGLWLRLAPGAQLAEPLHVVHVGGVAQSSAQLRLLIELGQNSEALVVEHYLGAGADAYHINVLAQATLAPGARLRHLKLLTDGPAAIHIGDFRVRVGRDARFESHALAVGGGLLRQDIDVHLDEPGGECSLRGLYTAGSGEHVDFHTRIEHIAPHCRSEETYKGLIGGSGRAVFNGRVHVHPGADKTDSAMTCANLLLSNRAEVDAKPELEIYADDVKCSHGATVGQLDEAQVFYLRARGIAEAAARELLMTAFARDALAGLDARLQDGVAGLIDARLPQL